MIGPAASLKKLFAPRRPEFAREAGRRSGTARAWIGARRRAPVLYTSITDEAIERAKRSHPQDVERTLDAAERILRHEFDLLGSGPFVPVDPDRPAREGYQPIDWYLDPVRNLRFPGGIACEKWDLYKMRPGQADIKYPWELARCQHWPVLGQAFRLTRDERYAHEIAQELDDFVDANPVGVGVNWTCTMDEAIRAVNWAIGLELVRDATSLDDGFWHRAYGGLFDHGVFVRGHLENTYEVTSNHFLSNVAGLLFVGAVFGNLPSGAAWAAFARESLEREIDVQVLPDGADFESSIPYHRLVTELFLGSLRLAAHSDTPLSAHYRDRVRDMIAYLAAVTRPDGLMPQVGDADDGRLHRLSGYGAVSPQDGRHLFGPAASIFDEPQWACLGGSAWETIWWGLTPVARASTPVAPVSRLFPDAGIAIMRASSHYALVTNGIVGTKGFGNHKHNDQLSFEYHPDGVALVVDPGSYVYTSDAAARNQFRGTGFHNTLWIDEVEQNETNPEWLFRLFESSRAEHLRFEDGPDAVEYAGCHHGYERLPSPVMHKRAIRMDKRSGALTITDSLHGRGTHRLSWHFHLAPGVAAERWAAREIALSAGGRHWRFRAAAGTDASVMPAGYSPSYGIRMPCLAIECGLIVILSGEQIFEFDIVPLHG